MSEQLFENCNYKINNKTTKVIVPQLKTLTFVGLDGPLVADAVREGSDVRVGIDALLPVETPHA